MRIGAVALVAASLLVPLAPAAEAGPRSRSRYYGPRQSHGHSHHHGDDGWAVVGGFAVGTVFGALFAPRPAPPPRRVVVYEAPPPPMVVTAPPPAPVARVPGVVYPSRPAPAISAPGARQVWIPARTIWRETQVVEPAVYETRQIPAYEEVEVPVFEDRSVPVTQEVVEPILETRCDPVTGVWSNVKVGEDRRTVVVGTRTERVQVGTRVDRRPAGTREVRVLVRAEATRVVRVAEQVPGRWAWVTDSPEGAPAFEPPPGEVEMAPIPPAGSAPGEGPAPASPATPGLPEGEPSLPAPIHPRSSPLPEGDPALPAPIHPR